MSSISHLIESWKQEQLARAARVKVEPLSPLPRFVAGVDCAFSADKKIIFAAAVLYDRVDRRVVEIARDRRPVTVPYVPGYLSFREGDAVLAAIRSLKHEFGVICFDGQGLAHPRRCGLATHIGVELDRPSIGMAKSVLVGDFAEPKAEAGSTSALIHKGETVGQVLRTHSGVKPIFLSVGHRVDLPSSRKLAMACVTRFRIPEPTRQADIEVARSKKMT
ncbi:deoxyribonuclease V [soil metagenome]